MVRLILSLTGLVGLKRNLRPHIRSFRTVSLLHTSSLHGLFFEKYAPSTKNYKNSVHCYRMRGYCWTTPKKLTQNLAEIRAGNFENFDFLECIESEKIASFENVIQHCLLSLDMRFPCPSMSLTVRSAKQHLTPSTISLDQHYLKSFQQRCPVFKLVGFFLFPDDLIRRRQINPSFL